MKQFISWVGKRVASALVTAVFFILAVIGIVYASVTFPDKGPGGVDAGGKFMTYFNNIFQDCGVGKALQGFDVNKQKICVAVTGSATPTPTPSPSSTPASVTCVGGTEPQYPSPNGSNKCDFAWNTANVGKSTVVTQATNGGTLNGTCGAGGVWSYRYTCPDAATPVVCQGGADTVASSDGSNSCDFSWSQGNVGTSAKVTRATNGGTLDGTCRSSGAWQYTASCPNKTTPSCSAGALSWSGCDFSWPQTNAGGTVSRDADSGGPGRINSTCGADGKWTDTTASCVSGGTTYTFP